MKTIILSLFIIFAAGVNALFAQGLEVVISDQKQQVEQIPFVRIDIQNPIFSPTAHLFAGVIFLPQVENIKRIKEWTLIIKNESDMEVAILKGKREIPAQIVWDALDTKSKPLPDGIYSYEFTVDEGDGVHVANGTDITIISQPPKITIELVDDIYFLDAAKSKISNSININVICESPVNIDYGRSFLSVINFNSKEVKFFNLKESSSQTFVWDGIDDTYNIVLPAGSYKIIATAFDAAGNMGQDSADFLIVNQPQKPAVQTPPVPQRAAAPQEKAVSAVSASSAAATSVQPKNVTPAPKAQAQTQTQITERYHRVYFDLAKTQLSPEAQNLIEAIAVYAKQNNASLRIDGYIDNAPQETAIKNLAANRAQAVKNYLVDTLKFPADKIKTVWHPAPQKSADTNRRARIEIIK